MFSAFGLLARVVLILVFAAAGIAKAMDRPAASRTARDFGVPDPVAGFVGAALPLTELAIAVLLVLPATVHLAAVLAAMLLAAFTVAIVVNLLKGRTPQCQCFGQIESAPIDWSTAARDVVLAGLATGIFLSPDAGMSAFAWVRQLPGIELAVGAWIVVLIATVAALGWRQSRQRGRRRIRKHAPPPQPAGLPVGAQAPAVALGTLADRVVSLDTLRHAGKPVLLVFVKPGCGPCMALLPDIADYQRQYRDRMTVAVISRGSVDANRQAIGSSALPVLLQQDQEVAEAYHVYGTPAALFVQPDGTIGSAVAAGPVAIAELIKQTFRSPTGGSSDDDAREYRPIEGGGRIGAQAPAFQLPDLSGRIESLSDYRGGSLLLLFWDPSCGFCQRMLPELKELERTDAAMMPKMLLISGGSAEANEAMGLQSHILLDANFRTGRRYQSHGTPSAILIDGDGRIRSELAMGAGAIMALARSASPSQPGSSPSPGAG